MDVYGYGTAKYLTRSKPDYTCTTVQLSSTIYIILRYKDIEFDGPTYNWDGPHSTTMLDVPLLPLYHRRSSNDRISPYLARTAKSC